MENSNKTPIIVAIIGLAGVIATAVIANSDKLFGPGKGTPTPTPVVQNAQTPSTPEKQTNVATPDQSDKVRVPNLVDLQFNVAEEKLRELGLVAKQTEEIRGNSNPHQVLKQRPQ